MLKKRALLPKKVICLKKYIFEIIQPYYSVYSPAHETELKWLQNIVKTYQILMKNLRNAAKQDMSMLCLVAEMGMSKVQQKVAKWDMSL